MWTEKYSPQTSQEIVGNRASIASFREWLQDWDDVVIRGKKKAVRPVRGNWADAPKPNAKACLLSGPPGIGKSTTAKLICKELGFEVLEMNASDSRNKKTILLLVGNLSTNKSLDYLKKQEKGGKMKKSVIIMDEIDGLGASDRGGVTAVIEVIKLTKTPIVCICNDRNLLKLRTLVTSYCFDVKFVKPDSDLIYSYLQLIAKLENISISLDALLNMITSSGNDIRQVLNTILLYGVALKSLETTEVKDSMSRMKKDLSLMLDYLQATTKLLNYQDFSKMNYREKVDMFFIDYTFVPVLVLDNYLTAMERNFSRGSLDDVERMAKAADWLSVGDTVNTSIMSGLNWTLLPDLALTHTIAPCHYSKGLMFRPGNFPMVFGKMSSLKKSSRLIRELRE